MFIFENNIDIEHIQPIIGNLKRMERAKEFIEKHISVKEIKKSMQSC